MRKAVFNKVNPDFSPKSSETRSFFQKYLQTSHNINRVISSLLILQWMATTLVAIFSPATYKIEQLWNFQIESWQLAVFFGGGITLICFFLAIFYSGKAVTRYAIAIGQVIIASLLSFLIVKNSESHLHYFFSLAVLFLYRDWRVLLSAAIGIILTQLFCHLPFSYSASEFLAAGLKNWSESFWLLLGVSLMLIFWWRRDEKNKRQLSDLEELLDANEQRYRKFIETAEDLIYRTDGEGFFTFMNPAFKALLGYSAEDKNLRYLETISPGYRKKVERFYTKQLLKKQPSTYFEFPVINKSGDEIWLGQKVQLIVENEEIKGFQAVARDISEVKKAQIKLAASEEKYRFLANFLPQHIWRMSFKGDFTYLNDPTFNYFGLDQKNGTPSLNWREVVHPDDSGLMLERWISSIRSRQFFEIECRIKAGDGSYRWFLGQAVPLIDENNKVTEFFGTSTDIHDRKMAQEEAAKNREYLNLFKHANDAIIIYNPETEQILDVNDFACKVFGYTREEFLSRGLDTIYPDPEKRKERIEKILVEGSLETYENSVSAKNGNPMHLSINSSLIEFRGNPAILTINRDITASVEADKALRKNETKLRSLIENMHEGLVEVDRHENILFVNQRFCEMVGYSEDELIGQNISLMLADSEGRETVSKAHEERYQGKTGIYEMKLYHKSGNPMWFLLGGVPVTDDDGKVVGSMGVHTDITDIKLNEELLWFNATHDALTELPNRHLLLDHLQNAISKAANQPERKFALLFLDLNLFKIINDSLGHVEGDNLLILLARRLETCVRQGDVISRFGGDEFTILIDNIRSSDEVIQVVRRIQDCLETPFSLNGNEVFVNTSIGIVLSNQTYQKPEEILRDADIAMYRAKSSGRSHYEIFTPQMHEQANRRLQMETELRLAMERKEFEVYYQPIVELSTRRITGFESLIRWIHPARGIISPADFIPLAEQNGLIIPIGEWILRESCRQLREWQQSDPLNSELNISVNLSCKQFEQENLIETVAAIIKETNIDPQNLRLEITESELVSNSTNPFETLNQLRDLGVKISIDDFGTGYSNLSYLHQLPINHLKIDRSFIKQINESQENLEIVRTILTLAQNLNFSVIAEGIETELQSEMLQELNCQIGQGYLFSKPVNALTAGKLLKKADSPGLPFTKVNLVSETVS